VGQLTNVVEAAREDLDSGNATGDSKVEGVVIYVEGVDAAQPQENWSYM
jgi:hypothetical protein